MPDRPSYGPSSPPVHLSTNPPPPPESPPDPSWSESGWVASSSEQQAVAVAPSRISQVLCRLPNMLGKALPPAMQSAARGAPPGAGRPWKLESCRCARSSIHPITAALSVPWSPPPPFHAKVLVSLKCLSLPYTCIDEQEPATPTPITYSQRIATRIPAGSRPASPRQMLISPQIKQAGSAAVGATSCPRDILVLYGRPLQPAPSPQASCLSESGAGR